ncbi:PREDICTED: uncharacterized protein LOC104587767 [Nelumbo nucifera]|uniref:Uncharacterized protein LOC104587767 n=2 Tax=Nelumbo nucifera TaxID=4432 RepID=A0A1U7Z9J9_NELNU|nr:PREDICTED: uncharacterized protein LOC104587767 [Nelumbo nucifera]DAD31985.1 TPA_asm: hypothetical protein HUJ06_010836 [Nelumbo nucifera]
MGSLRPRSLFTVLAAILTLLLLSNSLATFTSIPYGDEGVTWWSSRCVDSPRKLLPVPGNKGEVACKSHDNVSGIKEDRFQILRQSLSPPPPPRPRPPVHQENPRNRGRKETTPPPPPKTS